MRSRGETTGSGKPPLSPLMTAPRGTDPRLDLNPRRTTSQRRDRYHERMDAKAEARAELESERLAARGEDEDAS